MRTVLIFVLATAAFAVGQQTNTSNTPPQAAAPQKDPVSDFNKVAFNHVKGWLLNSAEKMPEQNFNFKPVDTVRSFGQILGHVADANYMFCSNVSGTPNPQLNIEKTKTSKAELIAALNDAFAYCSKTYDTMTDATGVQPAKFHGRDMAKFNILTANVMHMVEHYGNLVTYMRMKNIVPPSSEAPPAPSQKK
jgi:uncharacterized damage-inducible protein DinB